MVGEPSSPTDGTSVLVDTSALISYLRGDPTGGGPEVRYALSHRQVYVSAICVFELLAGVRSEAHRAQRNRLISLARILPVDEAIARRAAELFTSLRRRGVTVDNEDLIVAATALEQDIPVLSGNVRHFDHIPGLHVERLPTLDR